MANSDNHNHNAHVALIPSSGMGHLTPFLRLAVSLISHNVRVTLITAQTTVSLAESQALSCFFSTYPQITASQLPLVPYDSPSEDPFYIQYEAIRRSSHLLSPILCSITSSLSALITDMSLASTIIPVTQSLNLPNYVLFTSSAQMSTLFLSFHAIAGSRGENDLFTIPGMQPLPISWIPPPLLSEKDSLFRTQLMENGKAMLQADGILINTFENFEQEPLVALNAGEVITRLPPVTAIGPFEPCGFERSRSLTWLDGQPMNSVVFVSFGSRTAISREQNKELADGLLRSECRFIWVVKEKKVDREDGKVLDELVDEEFMKKGKDKGLVVNQWVNQEQILSHPAVGGFVSHCGWNSVTEAAWHGVPILAWPQHGDQKMNAYVLSKRGLGIWAANWGWGGEMVVKGTEISEKIREVMGNEMLRAQVIKIRENARAAVANGGSSHKGVIELIQIWKNKNIK
ncbi:UDP-glycosyltransferase 708G1 [Daucus carota subsp. sativus]|nr:PREDICTED: UDP-glycosyltransferase 13-like [Daucus carota subsp. sativus]